MVVPLLVVKLGGNGIAGRRGEFAEALERKCDPYE